MKTLRKLPEHVNVSKAAWYAVVINSMQVLAALGLAAYILLDSQHTTGHVVSDLIVVLFALLVSFGAFMDIREAISTRRMAVKMHGLHETVDQMNDLNLALRAQRHDFLNHLQVVYSLMEMEEYPEACRYIEQVYGDIQQVSKSLKTACAPVNALLRAKMAECEQDKIQLDVQVSGAWKDLPLPGWEMCRVLSNLIDNAMDALRGQKNACITVKLEEDLKRFCFSVENNGPAIPKEWMRMIFEPGVSQKGEGRGMGLHIARETLRSVGGELMADSTSEKTVFAGFVPRKMENWAVRG